MEQQESFRILEIEPTRDEASIKAAYRRKLPSANPEDHPEGFQRLRQAYEAALAYAREPEKAEPQEEDTSPSGIWVGKAAKLYASLKGRQDLEQWKALFDDDEFFSLEGEEECRRKLFFFLLNHFRYPTAIWKLFDEKLGIVRGEKELREWLPADFVAYMIHRCERGDDLDYSLFEGRDDADVDDYLRHTEGCWRAIQEKKFDYATRLADEADRMDLYHPTASVNRLYLLKQTNEEEAAERAQELRQRYPEDDMVLYHAATILWQTGRKSQAAEIFEKLKAMNDRHYMANRYLSQWYLENGDCHKAKECAEIVIGFGYDLEFRELLTRINQKLETELEERIRKSNGADDVLELCWCLLQDEKFYQGLQKALSIRDRVPDGRQTEYLGYLAKVYRECAMYEESIDYAHQWRERLQRTLDEKKAEHPERDLDRIQQSYMICISAFHSLAYRDKEAYQRALEEAEQIEGRVARQINVLMERARIYMEMGEFEKCLELVEILVRDRQVIAARAISIEAYRMQWNAGGVIREGRILIEQFPQFARAYDLMAKVYLDLGEREALGRLLKLARENKVKSALLEAYDYRAYREVSKDYHFAKRIEEFDKKYRNPLQETGNLEHFSEGEQVITSLFYMSMSLDYLNIRGLYYMAANQFEKASADFEKILESYPADCFAWNNLGCIYKYQGLYEKAMPCFRKAILYMSQNPRKNHYGNLADVYEKIGDYRAAAETYEKLTEVFGRQDNIVQGMIRGYANAGEKEKALETIQKYYGDKVLYACYEECHLYLKQEQYSSARIVLRKWNRLLRARPKKGAALAGRSWADYYVAYGWYCVLAEKKLRKGLRAMAFVAEGYNHNTHRSKADLLQELILLYFLAGNEKKCAEFSWLVRREALAEKRNPTYYQKSVLYRKAMTALFLDGTETAGKLLDREEDCLNCRYCTYPACSELLLVRYMAARRNGKTAECEEIKGRLVEKVPFDLAAKAVALYG